LEFHEPCSEFGLSELCLFNLPDEFALGPVLIWVGDRGWSGQVGTQFLQNGIFRRVVEFSATFFDG
jgi:hypothetical protein